ncbi:EamA family transporter [Microbulbifer sp. CNSA002]|uniref:EamA family transporter n=1 Tax=Microbulbifer sp. CNSA002 TaxID=3373604 RepID=UPI0039B5B5B2
MRYSDLLLGVLLMAMWGFNFIVIQMGAEDLDPLLLVALRFSLAAFPAVLFVSRPTVSWKYVLAYSLTFGCGVWGMATWAISSGLSAGMASLLLQVNVAISLLFGWVFLKEKIIPQKALGALLALGGLLLSLMVEDGTVPLISIALILIAATSWSISGLIVKASGTQQVFSFIVWGLFFAPLPLFAATYIQNGVAVFYEIQNNLSGKLIFSILFQAYPTTLLGYWFWNRLIVKYPLSTVAPLGLLCPVFGLFFSWLLTGESIGSEKLMAAIMIFSGLALGIVHFRQSFKMLRNSRIFGILNISR